MLPKLILSPKFLKSLLVLWFLLAVIPALVSSWYNDTLREWEAQVSHARATGLFDTGEPVILGARVKAIDIIVSSPAKWQSIVKINTWRRSQTFIFVTLPLIAYWWLVTTLSSVSKIGKRIEPDAEID